MPLDLHPSGFGIPCGTGGCGTSRDAEARAFRRLYFAQTEQVDVDRTGRILVPDRLGQFAHLGQEVVLLGVRDHLELWNLLNWKKYLALHSPRFDTVAEGAISGPNGL